MLFDFRQKSDLIYSSPRGAKNAENQISSEAPRAGSKRSHAQAGSKTQLRQCCIEREVFQVPSEKPDLR